MATKKIVLQHTQGITPAYAAIEESAAGEGRIFLSNFHIPLSPGKAKTVIMLQLCRSVGMLSVTPRSSVDLKPRHQEADKMGDQVQTLVVDNGSGWSKAGFAGDNNPR